jgi:hypothetical protein
VPDTVGPQLAAQVFALLYGLEMQRRLDPAAVTDETAESGLTALLEAALRKDAHAHDAV